MLLTRKSRPRSSRQSDHTKTSWPLQRDANGSGMDISPYHQVWPKPSCMAQRKGEEDNGRQRKRWEDNIRERTGLEFGKSQRAVENREEWRKLVAKSSVVPQRPWQSRDRWWWRWWWGNTKVLTLAVMSAPSWLVLIFPQLFLDHLPVKRNNLQACKKVVQG